MRRIQFIIMVISILFIGNPVLKKQNNRIEFRFSTSSVYAGQILFSDDFEKQSLINWHSSMEIVPYWEIKKIEGNGVLSGKGHAFIDAGGDDWTDYSFKIKVNMITGMFQLGFRISQNGRYYIGFDENKGALYLRKNKPWGKNFDLTETNMLLDHNKWYTINILIRGNNIKVFIDTDLKIDYTDTDSLLYGCISLISLDKSELHFDDVIIEDLVN